MTFDKKQPVEGAEAELEHVLQNFRQSVHAWSDAEYHRPRTVATATVHHTWRMALGWALGCVLAAGGLSAGLYQRHRLTERAKMDHATENGLHSTRQSQSAAPASQVDEKAAVADEQVAQAEAREPDAGFLAEVDSDVSQQVPSAMEPLAQLMESDSKR